MTGMGKLRLGGHMRPVLMWPAELEDVTLVSQSSNG